jgi:ribosomal protein S12 methylthiotransferase accessory factor
VESSCSPGSAGTRRCRRAGCTRVFGLLHPLRPGLCTIGAELEPDVAAEDQAWGRFSVSGVGLDPGAAFAACMGEAAERLAQLDTNTGQPSDGAEAPEDATVIEWPHGRTHRLPRDLLYRRPPHRRRRVAPAPLSIGCAAGPTVAAARLAALLEVLERDAVALWWRGGRAARPIQSGHEAARLAEETVLRLGGATRRVRLIDISQDPAIPVIAALSFDASGDGFCCGTAARPDAAEAARAAVLEMVQNELAVLLAQGKRAAQGEAVLNARDRAHLIRHARIRSADCMPPVSGLPPPIGACAGAESEQAFAGIAARLARQGHAVWLHAHDPERVGMPVYRVIVPGLAAEPSDDTPPRLAHAIDETGGGPGHKLRVPLFS